MIMPRRIRVSVHMALVMIGVLVTGGVVGCAERGHHHERARPNPYAEADTRHPIPLPPLAGQEYRAVMLQHVETIQVIVTALVAEDYELAKGLTETHVGFFMHRQAMAHHAAAAELAHIIPTKDPTQILPKFNNMLKACVACHLEYTLRSSYKRSAYARTHHQHSV